MGGSTARFSPRFKSPAASDAMAGVFGFPRPISSGKRDTSDRQKDEARDHQIWSTWPEGCS
jgi:hypothetical protein